MEVEARLASELVADHPIDAARLFERLPAEAVAALLEELDSATSARALQHMSTYSAAAVVSRLAEARAPDLLAHVSTESLVPILRHLDPSDRERLLAGLSGPRVRQLRSVLGFPEGTAGSLMDPEVLALPHDLMIDEAIARVREAAGHARYNVYVVDRDRVLLGVINLRELLMADPGQPLSSLMKTAVHRLPALAGRHAVASHPGWREVHSLPVVDERGRYLGAVRYRTMRRLEEGLHGALAEEGATARALGGLFRAGASAILEAMVASANPARARNDAR